MAVAARREARPARLDLRLVFGLVIALLAFLAGIMVYSSGRPETGAVLVAARNLPAGTVIGEGDLRVEQSPVSRTLQAALVSDRAQVVGKVAARPIAAGEPILTSSLAQGLPLEEGEMAVALPVLDRVYVPYQVRAGDRGFLYAIAAGPGAVQQSVLVSEKARVLAVVRAPQQAGAGPQVEGPPTNVTIAVPREEADLVARAIAQNIVALVLLPPGTEPGSQAPAQGPASPPSAPSGAASAPAQGR